MGKAVAILVFLAVLPAAAALAHHDGSSPMADWQPKRAVARLAEENGWTVRRIKIDDGFYEIDGSDAAGRPIEVTVDPVTLQVIEIEYEDEDDRPRHGREGRRDD